MIQLDVNDPGFEAVELHSCNIMPLQQS